MRPRSETFFGRQTGVEIDAAEAVFRTIFDPKKDADAAVDESFGLSNSLGLLNTNPGRGIIRFRFDRDLRIGDFGYSD